MSENIIPIHGTILCGGQSNRYNVGRLKGSEHVYKQLEVLDDQTGETILENVAKHLHHAGCTGLTVKIPDEEALGSFAPVFERISESTKMPISYLVNDGIADNFVECEAEVIKELTTGMVKPFSPDAKSSWSDNQLFMIVCGDQPILQGEINLDLDTILAMTADRIVSLWADGVYGENGDICYQPEVKLGSILQKPRDVCSSVKYVNVATVIANINTPEDLIYAKQFLELREARNAFVEQHRLVNS